MNKFLDGLRLVVSAVIVGVCLGDLAAWWLNGLAL